VRSWKWWASVETDHRLTDGKGGSHQQIVTYDSHSCFLYGFVGEEEYRGPDLGGFSVDLSRLLNGTRDVSRVETDRREGRGMESLNVAAPTFAFFGEGNANCKLICSGRLVAIDAFSRRSCCVEPHRPDLPVDVHGN